MLQTHSRDKCSKLVQSNEQCNEKKRYTKAHLGFIFASYGVDYGMINNSRQSAQQHSTKVFFSSQ